MIFFLVTVRAISMDFVGQGRFDAGRYMILCHCRFWERLKYWCCSGPSVS